MWPSSFWITWLWKTYTFQMTVHWLLLTQLRCIACIICPRIAFHLLQCHGFSASLLFCLRNACYPASCLHCTEELGEKLPVSGFHVTTSCVFQSLAVTLHCFPLPRSRQYLWEHLCINFLLDYRSYAKDNLAWCGFKTGISLWCCSPLPALICSTLYSPMPDGKLKSIILPTEMCFPEHYIKPQSKSARSLGRGAKPPARWHCCPTEKPGGEAERHEGETIEGLHATLRFWWNNIN